MNYCLKLFALPDIVNFCGSVVLSKAAKFWATGAAENSTNETKEFGISPTASTLALTLYPMKESDESFNAPSL